MLNYVVFTNRVITVPLVSTLLFIIILHFTETSADQEQVEDLHHMSEHQCMDLRRPCTGQEGPELQCMDPKLLFMKVCEHKFVVLVESNDYVSHFNRPVFGLLCGAYFSSVAFILFFFFAQSVTEVLVSCSILSSPFLGDFVEFYRNFYFPENIVSIFVFSRCYFLNVLNLLSSFSLALKLF